MLPSFIAFLNKAGVACAADTDGTVFKLAKNEPLAIAVNPQSPIPWERIITQYKLIGEPKPQVLFSDYVAEFNAFLNQVTVDDTCKDLSSKESNIIFLGYGSEDLYPSVVACVVSVNQDSHLCIDEDSINYVSINNHDKFTYNLLGDFESVATILWGATKKTTSYFTEKYLELYQIYRQRILDTVKGEKEELAVKQRLDAFDAEAYVSNVLDNATGDVFKDMRIGIDAFSIQDMVDAVETLVNSNVKLNHLKSGAVGVRGDVREIAVITRPEGVTWIKHGIYAQ